MKIPTTGLRTDDDLDEIIIEVLKQHGIKPTRELVEDIFTLCVKVAANEQYLELREIVREQIKNLRLE
jgi:hypothetical protein